MAEQTFSSQTEEEQTSLTKENQEPNTETKPTTTYVEVNGRRYTLEEAQKKILNADDHITTLEKERVTDRERVEKLIGEAERAKTLEEVLERMEARPQDTSNRETPSEVDTNQIIKSAEDRANQVYDQREAQRLQEQNLASISTRLKQEYGDTADDVAFGKMGDLGYNREEAFALAQTKPQAFLHMLGLEKKDNKRDVYPTKGDVRTNVVDHQEQPNNKSNNLMKARSTKERIDMYNNRVAAKMAELGIN